MGCFSYLCKECGKAVNSDSHSGEECRIYFLKNGEVDQEMRGQYDSYGRVFDANGESQEWKGEWSDLVTTHFNDSRSNGFAIIHERCYSGREPDTISADDPDQGWGEYRSPVTGNLINGWDGEEE